MANVTVSIPDPFLPSGSYFVVRYRGLPGGAWTTVSPNQTNAPFVLSGLVSGNYELEATPVIYGTPCPPKVWPFSVTEKVPPGPCPCVTDGTATIVKNREGQFSMYVVYTLPSSAPPCGYRVTYGPIGGPYSVVTYASLPLGGLALPLAQGSGYVKIESNCCDYIADPLLSTGYRTCFETQVGTSSPPTCTPGSYFTDASAIQDSAMSTWRILVQIYSMSSPPSTTITVAYQQKNLNAAGSTGAPDSGSMTFQPYALTTPPNYLSTLYVPITPNLSMLGPVHQLPSGFTVRNLNYDISITDLCGTHINPSTTPGQTAPNDGNCKGYYFM